MIDVDEAYEVLREHVSAGETTEAPLSEAVFRTLAEPVRCDVDYPPFARADMDGYAVRAADVGSVPVSLLVVGQIAAGSEPATGLRPGEAVQINTGAPVPPGCDAVVRVEDTELSESSGEVLIRATAVSGRFITPRARYVSAGEVVLEAGVRLTPLAIGAAAAAGTARVTVYRRPSVAVLSTGDELIDIDRTPGGATVRNSNQYMLEALILSAHAEPVLLGVARDDRDALRKKIEAGLRSDALCITGGVSAGAFDFVPEVLEACGARFHIRKMAIKPGRPTIFATTPAGRLIFALPGNPAGALVGFELLVRPALSAMEGRPGEVPVPIRATLRGCISAAAERRRFVPARGVVDEDGGWTVEALSWHGSGDSFGMATANALIVRSPGAAAVSDGAVVSALLLDRV